MEGYLKLYRQIIDSEVFASPNALKIWIWCLCKASYKEKYMTIQIGRGESSVKLDVGSFLFGRFKAEQELDLSGSMIYRWMKRFEDLGMINIVSNSHYSIITICNWETYQDTKTESEQPLNSRWTADEQPMNTNKKDKKDKNIKKEIYKERKIDYTNEIQRDSNALSNFDKAHSKAYDKALTKHVSKQVQSTCQSIDSIDKHLTLEPLTNNTGDLELGKYKDKTTKEKDWRNSFEVYKAELKQAYISLINDVDYIKQRQGYHNNLDIPKSLEKACVDYWATEEGWAKKKKTKSKTIDWRSTFNNALSLQCNQVRK
jgi:hypothetical protein